MKTTIKVILAISAMALTSVQALAVPISVTSSQQITQDGQLFGFIFANLADSDGTGGQFNFFARGDYTQPVNETATVSLDFLGGTVEIGDSGIVENSIAGLSLFANNTVAGGGGTDQILDYVFTLSGALLDSLLSDNSIAVSVANSDNVTNQNLAEHVVTVGFSYNSAEATSVSEPGMLALFGMGALLIGFSRRRFS